MQICPLAEPRIKRNRGHQASRAQNKQQAKCSNLEFKDTSILCQMWGTHSAVTEDSSLLGRYAVPSCCPLFNEIRNERRRNRGFHSRQGKRFSYSLKGPRPISRSTKPPTKCMLRDILRRIKLMGSGPSLEVSGAMPPLPHMSSCSYAEFNTQINVPFYIRKNITTTRGRPRLWFSG